MSSIALTTVSKASDAIDYRVTLNCNANITVNGQEINENGYLVIDAKDRPAPFDSYFSAPMYLGALRMEVTNYPARESLGKDPQNSNYYVIEVDSLGAKKDGLEISFGLSPYVKIKENKQTGECLAYKDGNYTFFSGIKNESLGLDTSTYLSCELVRVSFKGNRCPVLNK